MHSEIVLILILIYESIYLTYNIYIYHYYVDVLYESCYYYHTDNRVIFESDDLKDELYEICYDLKAIYSSMGLPMADIDDTQRR